MGEHVRKGACLHVEVNADGSDAWKLAAVADIIRAGGVRNPLRRDSTWACLRTL